MSLQETHSPPNPNVVIQMKLKEQKNLKRVE